MCIAGDTIGLEVIPYDEPNVVPPRALLHVLDGRCADHRGLNMEELAAEKQYEFAFLGFPMKIRGATGAPMPSVAVPLK